jgi:glycerol-3-phosphate dehydrogenase
MNRNLTQLLGTTFDVAIIGGGIYGAALAREAAQRGLSAALIDKGDFCGATSANSLKIIHGGLRYLQQMDLIRVRESVRERRAMLRIAPHLVDPLPCLMPTGDKITRSKAAMAAGLIINGIMSVDRNRGVSSTHHLPLGSIASRKELESLMPGYQGPGTGAAIWYDAVANDTERVVIEMVQSAVEAGACAANYLAQTGFIYESNRIAGIQVRDQLSETSFDIKAKLVINAAGPWSNAVLDTLKDPITPLPYALALGMNAILKEELIPTYAAGLPCQTEGPDKGRLMFIVPWNGTTMAGTYYRHHTDTVNAMLPTEVDTARLVSQLNAAMPSAKLSLDSVSRIHAGLLPCEQGHPSASDPKLLRHYMLIDHAKRDNLEGLITTLGVKYTTARDVAERTINLAAAKLSKTVRPSCSATQPLQAGGTDINNAINNEMAQTLSDVIYRRSGLGATATPSEQTLRNTAEQMAQTLNWDDARIESEITHARNPLT